MTNEPDGVWLHDPAHCDDVCQGAKVTRKRSGPPSDTIGGSSLVVDHSEVRNKSRGRYRRRRFYVHETDRYGDPMGAYRYGAPVEAVNPITVCAGEAAFITDRV